MRPLRSVLVAFLVLVSGCFNDPLSSSEERQLREAKELWAEKGGLNYTVESRLSCFCPTHLAYWTKVTVRNGAVTAAEPVDPLPAFAEPSIVGWSTIAELFARIEERDAVVTDIDARFDPALGYPLEVTIRCQSNVADCGSSYTTRNLTIP
ncbi:MAG: hypothetical protein H7066_00205 [Cytophagaceae bacterium]|nr:hypothetical protein [Gemmatimonadaceae bacterium]